MMGEVFHGLYREEDMYSGVGDSHFSPFDEDSFRVSFSFPSSCILWICRITAYEPPPPFPYGKVPLHFFPTLMDASLILIAA